MVYRELMLRLRGTLTVSAANNTTAKTLRGDEWAVISRLELIVNGTDVLRSIDGNALWWENFHLFGSPPPVSPLIGDATTLNPAFDVFLIIPLWSPRSVKPMDTALDSREMSSIELAITWADHLAINASATGFTVAPILDIYSHESFNVSGPFSQRRVFPIERTITAANTREQIQLPVGNMYRGFLINTHSDAVDVSTILNRFKLVAGTTVFADLTAGDSVLADWYRLRNGLPRIFDSVGGVYLKQRRGANNDIAGWYWYDHVTDGFLTEAIDTLGFSEFFLELDVSVPGTTDKIVVYPQEIIPVRAGQNNG